MLPIRNNVSFPFLFQKTISESRYKFRGTEAPSSDAIKMKRSYILSMYFMSEISTTPHSGIAIGKYKCLVKKKKNIITAIYSFLKNRQSAAVNVNRVLHVIVEQVRVGIGSVLALWSKQGWYLSYFAFFKQAGLIPELFCVYYNFHKYCKFTSTIYVCGSLSRNKDWPRICTFESNTLAGPFTTRISNYSIIMPFEANTLKATQRDRFSLLLRLFRQPVN